MPYLVEVEAISAHLRRAGVEVVGEPPRRRRFVEDGDHLDVVLELRRPPPDRARQLAEDSLFLLQRARLRDGELVAQLQQLLRLDEQRLPGVAGVVHDAGQVRLVLGADRQHVAIAAHRVVGVAQHLDDLLVFEQLLEPLLDGAVQSARPIAQLGQERARGVEQLPGRIEGALQLLCERRQLRQLPGQLVVERGAIRLREAEPARRIRGADEPGNLQQLLRLQRPLARGAPQRRPHVHRIGERQLTFVAPQQPRFLDAQEPGSRHLRIVAREKVAAALAPHRCARPRGEFGTKLWPAEFFQRLVIDYTEQHRAAELSPASETRHAAIRAGRDTNVRDRAG